MARGLRKKEQIVNALNDIEQDIENLKRECDIVGVEKSHYSTRYDILYAKKETLLWVLKED